MPGAAFGRALPSAAWLLEHMSEAYCLVGRDFCIVEVNAAGCALVRQPAASLIGRLLWEAVPGLRDMRSFHACSQALHGAAPFTLQEQHARSGRWFEVRGFSRGGGLAIFLRDISEQRFRSLFDLEPLGGASGRAEDALRLALAAARAQAERLAMFGRSAIELGRRLGRPGLARHLADDVRLQIGAHQAALCLRNTSTGQPVAQAVSLSSRYAAWRGAGLPAGTDTLAALVMEHGTTMCLTQHQLAGHPRWVPTGDGPHDDQRRPPPRGWLAAPMFGRDGKAFGLLQLSDKYEGDFDAEDLAVLQQMAQLAAAAVETDSALQRAGAAPACNASNGSPA
jgi:hypothetical protein